MHAASEAGLVFPETLFMQMFMLTVHNRYPKDNSYLCAGFLFQ